MHPTKEGELADMLHATHGESDTPFPLFGQHEAMVDDKWTVVLSDTDNDLRSVKYSLWVAGVCNKEGIWKGDMSCLRIVHTGDYLNKWNPEPEVVDFFRNLKESAPPRCEVILLNGNHEVEILKRCEEGIRTRLSEEHLEFLRQQDIMFVTGNTLYLHGYPTFQLLRLLMEIHREHAGLNAFNRRFRKAFFEGKHALFREEEGLELVGDITGVRKYFLHQDPDGESHGRKISRLLRGLGIHTVVHGHQPNSFTQVDHELRIEVPGIRIIDNDNRVKHCGLGAALIDDNGNVLFVNLKEMYLAGGEKSFRKKLRKMLGTR